MCAKLSFARWSSIDPSWNLCWQRWRKRERDREKVFWGPHINWHSNWIELHRGLLDRCVCDSLPPLWLSLAHSLHYFTYALLAWQSWILKRLKSHQNVKWRLLFPIVLSAEEYVLLVIPTTATTTTTTTPTLLPFSTSYHTTNWRVLRFKPSHPIEARNESF